MPGTDRDMTHKVGLFIPTMAGGGAQRIALNLAQGLLDHQCDVDLILVKAEGALIEKIPSKVKTVTLDVSRTLTSIPKLASHLRRAGYDTLISFMSYANICAVVATWLSSVSSSHRLVLTEHSLVSRRLEKMDPVQRLATPRLLRSLYPSAEVVVAVSQDVARDLERVVSLSNIHVIPNPISVHTDSESARKEQFCHPWFGHSAQIVLGAGRLAREKDFSSLVTAVRHLRDGGLDVRLIIIGEGEERENLNALILEATLEKYVSLPGFVDEPHEYMQAADVLVLSSLWEGFGNVLVEAMACGTPVISTDCPGGPAEILEGGRFGELVPVGDSDRLANAIARTLTRSPVSPGELIERADDFSPYKIAGEYLSVIERSEQPR